MGFRLIRSDAEEYQQKMAELKQQELWKEALRWTNMTQHRSQAATFVDRFEFVKQKSTDVIMVESLTHLHHNITAHKANLVSIQGNMDVRAASDLLE